LAPAKAGVAAMTRARIDAQTRANLVMAGFEGPKDCGDDGVSGRVVLRFNAGVEPIPAHERRMACLPA
jgi:hypothetical protein